MEAIKRLYLDTNVFIELGEGEDARQQLLYDIVASQAAGEPLFLCTCELTLAELLVRPYRDRNDQLIELYDNWIFRGNTWLDVGPVTRDVLWAAALVRRQYPGVKLPDAIHISAAFGFQCSHFLTADLKVPETIQITNDRWGKPKSSPELRIVSSTIENLQSILSSRA
ncbi:type II toxin-antitoxin system VapC family toxin [Nitratireductor soli]|uniref:type II toxin-antitoxin system VapC family toxin n=1 Tax=Nitratireductor soli TaxID=1670619 RepID=UPI00065E8AD3|nr:PIN domain-containing protein [Nitratireductor soli]